MSDSRCPVTPRSRRLTASGKRCYTGHPGLPPLSHCPESGVQGSGSTTARSRTRNRAGMGASSMCRWRTRFLNVALRLRFAVGVNQSGAASRSVRTSRRQQPSSSVDNPTVATSATDSSLPTANSTANDANQRSTGSPGPLTVNNPSASDRPSAGVRHAHRPSPTPECPPDAPPAASTHPPYAGNCQGGLTTCVAAHEVVVGAAMRDGRVLLGRRSPSKALYPNLWSSTWEPPRPVTATEAAPTNADDSLFGFTARLPDPVLSGARVVFRIRRAPLTSQKPCSLRVPVAYNSRTTRRPRTASYGARRTSVSDAPIRPLNWPDVPCCG